MLTQEQHRQVEPRAKVIQIICLALVGGSIAFFLAVFAFRTPPKFTTEFGLFQIMGIAVVLMELLPAILIPATMRKSAVSNVATSKERLADDTVPGRLIDGFVSSKIVQFALFQGAVFMNLIFYLIDGSMYNLAAAGFCLFSMLVLFPTNGKVFDTVGEMLRAATTTRQSS